MVDQNSQFYAILTNVGAAKQANADALGIAWKITQMGVGDANGTDPTPNATQTKLINEWRRAPLNQLKVDDTDSAIIVAEQVIPAEVGGKWIREIGLYDADGDLVAVANCAPTYKPLLSQGSGRTQVVRMSLIVSSSSNVQLKIDPSVVLATREWVTEELARQDFKHSVVVATTANIALTGLQTIDGVALLAGNRVLVKNQTAAKENGLYEVSAGAWTRTKDADTSAKVTPGLLVLVEKGTVNGDSAWQLVTDALISLGVSGLAFDMAFGRTGVTAGTYRSVTVDKYGRVVGATNPTTVAGYGLTDVYTKTEVDSALASKAPLASPALSGVPTAPTAPTGSSSQQIANTAFVQAALAALVAAAPGALDTLNELAAAIGDDPNFAATMTNALASKAPLASPTFTGSPKAPTQALTVNDTTLATTQFVQSLLGGMGWGAGGVQGSNLPNGTNLNNVLTPGSYGQPSNAQATLELNYPEPYAGTLLVQAAGLSIFTQFYTLYQPSNRTFSRTCYSGTWSAWSEIGRLHSPVFTGTPQGPTAPLATNNQQLANTAFVYGLLAQLGLGGVGIGTTMPDFDDATVPAGIYYVNSSTLNLPFGGAGGALVHKVIGSIGFQLLFPAGSDRLMWRRRTANIWQAWNDVATLDSPTFSGAPTAPTALKGTKSKQLATTEFVQDAIATLVDSSPGALDTLRELASALANDPNFATTMTNQLATKAPLASPALTGTPTAPTLSLGGNAQGLVNLQHLRNTLNQYGLGGATSGPTPATTGELAAWPSGNYYYPTAISPYPAFAFVMRMVYSGDRGFEIANIPYTDRVFLRSSNGDGTWRAPMELAPLISPAFSGVPTCPTAPTATNNGQLASTAFVRAVVAEEGVQPGEISFYATAAAPRGYIKANGAAVSRTAYPELFAAIGTIHGAGNGTTTFNVPDMRGEFVRGLDDGRGVDPGRVLGSWQNHLYASHNHVGTTDTQGAHAHTVTGSTTSSGSHSHTMNMGLNDIAGSRPAVSAPGANSGVIDGGFGGGDHSHSIYGTSDTAGAHSHTLQISASGGSETRGRNVALMAYIKI